MSHEAPATTPRPTDAELDLLSVLWRLGPSTVREVQDGLPAGDRRRGYTTVLKLLQIMAEKGLVERDERARAHVYRAAASERETQGALIDHLMDRAFGGSASQLVMRALGTRPATAKELAEIRRLLDDYSGQHATGDPS